jgi:microcompartment protein CcmL/EutN
MKTNKKGYATVAIVGVIIAVVVAIFAGVAYVKATSTVTSQTPVAPGCKPGTVDVFVKGEVKVTDKGNFLDLRPGVDAVSVNSVTVNNVELLSIWGGEEKFGYKVYAQDITTGQDLASYSGEGILRNSDNNGVYNPYVLHFYSPDNNCDGKIDDFDVKVYVRLTGDVPGEYETGSTVLSFKGGKIS